MRSDDPLEATRHTIGRAAAQAKTYRAERLPVNIIQPAVTVAVATPMPRTAGSGSWLSGEPQQFEAHEMRTPAIIVSPAIAKRLVAAIVAATGLVGHGSMVSGWGRAESSPSVCLLRLTESAQFDRG